MTQPLQGLLEGQLNLAYDLDALAVQYAEARFVRLPHLLTPYQAALLLSTTQDVASKRVICGGISDVTWDEQNFGSLHPAYQFFHVDTVLDIVQAVSGLKTVRELRCWTSGYGPGEYINPHRDKAGTVQLLVCLLAPSDPRNGGTLCVNGVELFLTPGEAVLFEATTLEHYTTPLIPSEEAPDPRRVVLVGRYFD